MLQIVFITLHTSNHQVIPLVIKSVIKCNKKNTWRVLNTMVIDPMEGNSNAQARRAGTLLFPISRVWNHPDKGPGDFVSFMAWHQRFKSFKVILSGLVWLLNILLFYFQNLLGVAMSWNVYLRYQLL